MATPFPRYGIERVANPASMIVSVPDAKVHCRILGSDIPDSDITAKIRMATEFIENQTGHIFSSTQFRFVIDQFPYYIVNRIIPYDYKWSALLLPRYPTLTVDSFTYVDQDGITRTMVAGTDYQLSNKQLPNRLLPYPGTTWPFANPYQIDAVTILFTCGYASNTPYTAIEAVKMMTAHLLEQRQPVITGTIVAELPLGLKNLIRQLKRTNWIG